MKKNIEKTNEEQCVKQHHHCPAVLVHGFLGFGEKYWGIASQKFAYRVIIPNLGPVSSLHDRAVELFYQLKGGVVDYGEEHANEFKHEQFGEEYTGLYPQWNEDNPIHLVGHSYGGNTIRLLQQLLAEKKFFGHNTNEKWIRSITTISTPHKGSTGAYILGEKEWPPGDVHAFSPGFFLTKLIHVYEYLDISFWKKFIIDFKLDHWNLSRKKSSIFSFLRSILYKSDIADGKDNGAFDLTIHSMSKLNERIKTYPTCYYKSYALCHTFPEENSEYHVPHPNMNPLMKIMAYWTGRKKFKTPQLIWEHLKEELWFESDGLASFFSQVHPHVVCSDDVCHHVQAKDSPKDIPCVPGKWFVVELKERAHLDIVPFPQDYEFHEDFFQELFQYLDNIDSICETIKNVQKDQ